VAAYFLDSSAAVKLYLTESGTPWLLNLADPSEANELYVVRIASVEVAAAVYHRARVGGAGRLDASTARRAVMSLRRDFLGVFNVIEVTASLCNDAERLAERRPLRGYDCVQLAAALVANRARSQSGFDPVVLLTADRDLGAAAEGEGVRVEDPNDH